MSPKDDPKNTPDAGEPEFEATDGGWDPYVAKLLLSGGHYGDTELDDDDGSTPVMILSRTPPARGTR